ncbi:MAG: M20 family peptidase [Pseudomonadales bacterium]|nr:M20 family peptidase [Pseudomonadales bacterium]MDG1441297.1 M20 family peptidase [Pseudomonadales bacterium]
MKVLKHIAGLLLVIVGIIVVRTFMHAPAPMADVTQVNIDIDSNVVAQHLSESITFKTVSNQSMGDKKAEEFDGFIQWVKDTYPQVNQQLELVMLNQTLLYKWQGSDASLKPILITGHYDVVPVIPGSEDKWQHPPFEGKIVDGIVWGRGALDDKSGVVGMLEATTFLLADGFQPARTVYLSFGHDEEIGGPMGAAAVTAYLKEQNVQLAWSLDEGSFLFKGMFPGVDNLIASINVAEKGSVTLDIVATAAGGHSSMPPKNNAVGVLAKAINKLEEHPVPGGLQGLSATMFDEISRYFEFPMRMLFANRWLFDSLIDRQLSSVTFSNAMLRTTTAPTMLSGSVKTNVLPIEAIATVNFRVHPRDTPESVQAYVESVVADEQITVRSLGGRGASEVSSWETQGFEQIAQSLREVYGDVAVTPGLMIAGSDSRHYGQVADDAYRFNPFELSQDDLAGFHGTNEKMSVDAFVLGIKSYIQIMRHGAGS